MLEEYVPNPFLDPDQREDLTRELGENLTKVREEIKVTQTKLDSKVADKFILDLADELLKEYELDKQEWTIKLIDEEYVNDGVAGYCWYPGRVIILTREYLIDTDPRNVRETVLHEIAHALTTGEHNKAYRKKLKTIGGTGLWYCKDGTSRTFPTKY